MFFSCFQFVQLFMKIIHPIVKVDCKKKNGKTCSIFNQFLALRIKGI